MIVVDASVVLELLLRTPLASLVEERIFSPEETLHAPHLIDLEILQVLRRYTLTGEMDSERGQEAINDFQDLPIFRYPHYTFSNRIWDLKHNMTAYDAVYIALAEGLSSPLLTCDSRLSEAPGHQAEIELL